MGTIKMRTYSVMNDFLKMQDLIQKIWTPKSRYPIPAKLYRSLGFKSIARTETYQMLSGKKVSHEKPN